MTFQRPPPGPFDEERDDSEDISFDDWPWAPEEEGRAVELAKPAASVQPAEAPRAAPEKLALPEGPAAPERPDSLSLPAHKRVNRGPRRSIPAEVEGWPPPEGTVLLGKYVVEKVLGKGGMGVVVVAHHMHLQQKVAIKFLHPAAMNDPDVLVRFQREARVLAQIQSEHVVRILDVGTLDKGEPYMVMEYLEGTDLSRAVKVRGPLPVDESVDYVVQALEPLAEAHLQSIIHRDLKPSNLYLARRPDGTYTIKLIDFGISKIQSESELSMTKTSIILGSPLYISPEQLRSASDVDPRSDIWAIGVILYKLLTGHPPFMADTIAQLCTMIIMNPPPRIADVRPDVPAGLEAVIVRCIQKDPAQRFQNVGELAEALAPFCRPDAEAHESVARIRRLFKNATPRAVGMGAVPLPLVTPQAMPVSGHSIPTDGGSALTLAGAAGQFPMPPERSSMKRVILPAVAAGLVFAALVVGALFVVRARSGSVTAPGATTTQPRQEDLLPPPTHVAPVDSAPPAPAASAEPTAVAPTTASAPAASTTSAPPRRPPAWAPPPKKAGGGKPVDNSEFGDRK